MSHLQRRRIESISDSTPSSNTSEGSEGSEILEAVQDWNSDGEAQSLSSRMHTLNIRIGSRSQNKNSILINDDQSDDVEIRQRHDTINSDEDDSGILSDDERSQIESFFSGLGTEVYVSPSLANLYESVGKEEWRLVFTGVPVLLHDKGYTRSRCTPRVTYVLAERGSCFAMWKDTIDNLSDYKVSSSTFHTMCLSVDHRKVIGFSFDTNEAAREIWVRIEELISHPDNIALSIPGRKRKQKRNKPASLPPKSQISQPCQFNHITKVTAGDALRYFSLQAFLNPPVKYRAP